MSGVDMVGFPEADPGVLLRNITATAITANPSNAKASVSRLQYFLIVLLMTFLSFSEPAYSGRWSPKRPAKPAGALGLKLMLNLKSKWRPSMDRPNSIK